MSWITADTTLLDLVYAFLRAARRSAGNWSGCCCYPTGRGLSLPSRRSGGGLAERTCCCRWLSLALLAISRMPCSVAVSGVMLPTVPNLRTHTQVRRRKNPGMERSGPALTAFRRAGWPGGNRRSTNCCSGAPLLLGCIALHSCACACLYLCGLRMCADSTCPFYLVVSGRLAGRSAG